MLSVFQARPDETLEGILDRLQATIGQHRRDDFFSRFETVLARLEETGRPLHPWEEDSLLSALDAASIREYERATVLLAAATEHPTTPVDSHFDRQALPVASVRWRLECVRSGLD